MSSEALSWPMRVSSLSLVLTLTALGGCERGAKPSPDAGAQPEREAKTVSGEIGPRAASHDEGSADEVEAEVDPGPPPAPNYAELLAELIAGATPTAEAEAEAWVHYKAKDYPAAQRQFALASLHDTQAWKHPFNLACVSARLHDEDMVMLGLREALQRDHEATADKARDDGDLAAYRGAPWFAPVLGPAPEHDYDDWEVPPQDPAQLAGPKLSEPSILPPGRHTPITGARLDQLRAALFERHALFPQIRATLEYSDAAGASRGYVVYDYPVLDACMLTRHKRACLLKYGAELDPGDYRPGYDQTHCTSQWIAHIRFGERIELSPRALKFRCGPASVYRLDLFDADGDGVDEVVIDVRSFGILLGMRYSQDSPWGRVFEVRRLDDSVQFEFAHSIHLYDMVGYDHEFRRVVVRDLDGDGDRDFVVQTCEIERRSYDPIDDEMWPDLSDMAPDVRGELQTEIHKYRAERDSW